MTDEFVRPFLARAKFLIMLQWIMIIIFGLTILTFAWLWWYLGVAISGDMTDELATLGAIADQVSIGIKLLRVFVFVLAATLYCLAVFRMIKNLKVRRLDIDDLSPGMAATWNFIPFANLVMPFRVMAIGWNRSNDPQGVSTSKNHPLMPWWWAGWLIGPIILRVSDFLAKSAGVEETDSTFVNLELLQTSLLIAIVGNLILIGGFYCFIRFFSRLAIAHENNIVLTDVSVFGNAQAPISGDALNPELTPPSDRHISARRRRRR